MNRSLIRQMNEEYGEYLRDESRTVGQAESISFPRSEEEVITILRELHPHSTPVTIQGARTGLAAGAVPRGGHLMNLTRMDRILGMRRDEAGSFYLRLYPGVVLSQLRKNIELKNFRHQEWSKDSVKAYGDFCDAAESFFSPDPTEASATIGGMAACNASGARSYRYGPIRRHISGLRVVLVNGETLLLKRGENIAAGRRLVLTTEQGSQLAVPLPAYVMPETKNASGYYIADDMDAVDLLIGSDGTLGVITEIEIRLLTLPAVVWGVTCFFSQEKAAIDFVVHLRQRVEALAAMEFFDGDALKILQRQKRQGKAFAQLLEILPGMEAAIYLELHENSESDALEQLKTIGQVMEQFGGNRADTWVARMDVDRDRLLFFRHAVPESVNMLIDQRKKQYPAITKLGTDMAVPDDSLSHIMAVYRQELNRHGLESAVWGHVGNNHLHVNILPRAPQDYEKGKHIYAEWAREVTRLGGAVSAEHGVGKLKSSFLKVMYGEEAVREMAALKHIFDPKGLLGTGTLFDTNEGGTRP